MASPYGAVILGFVKSEQAMSKSLPADAVRDLFDYSEGQLHWRTDFGTRAKQGQPAGHRRPCGNVVIAIGGVIYQRSRLVFAWHHRTWPTDCLLHLNGDRSDDCLGNLAHLPTHEVRRRARKAKHLPGTQPVPSGHWRAAITVRGAVEYLGTFDTEQEAHEAFRAAHAAHHGTRSAYYRGAEKC